MRVGGESDRDKESQHKGMLRRGPEDQKHRRLGPSPTSSHLTWDEAAPGVRHLRVEKALGPKVE